MKRITMTLATLALLTLALAARPAAADAPAITSAALSADYRIDAGGRRLILPLKLTPGSYLLTAQALVGAADSGTTCVGELVVAHVGAASAQVSTHAGGELAPLPVALAVTVAGDVPADFYVTCDAPSKAKAHPNAFAPSTDADTPTAATWLIATRVR
jgi:hypothetical protein